MYVCTYVRVFVVNVHMYVCMYCVSMFVYVCMYSILLRCYLTCVLYVQYVKTLPCKHKNNVLLQLAYQ